MTDQSALRVEFEKWLKPHWSRETFKPDEEGDGWSPINAQRRQIADLILFGDYRISSPLRWEQGFGDDIEHRFEISNGDERYGIVIIKTKLAAPKAAEKSGRSE